ncbi:MAG: hypothetical protein WA224_17130, partial [Candidatus Acidiferrales bacterium]
VSGGGKSAGNGASGGSAADGATPSASGNGLEMTLDALKQLQKQMDEISTRLGKIETRLSDTKK